MPRKFTDDTGVDWQVREVANAKIPERLGQLLGPERRRSGWLAFSSSTGERRRLSPYPPDWETVSDFEIARWCAKAEKVPPAPARRKQD